MESEAVRHPKLSARRTSAEEGCGTGQLASCDARAEPLEAVQPKVLDPLSTAELSTTYGRGFELLQRMGFKAGAHGLRDNSLSTPLRAHNQGKSRRGVQGADEGEPAFVAQNEALGARLPLPDLLRDVLVSMREAGDHEEAQELEELAACVGLDGSLAALKVPSAKKRHRQRKSSKVLTLAKSSSSSSSSSGGRRARDPTEQEAVLDTLHRMLTEKHFPVEMEKQEQHLRWRRRPAELGDYETFIERQSDAFYLVRCPAPHGALVLPRTLASVAGNWTGGDKYTSWCRDRRVAAIGRAKKKWKHVEGLVGKICRSLMRRADATVEAAHSEQDSTFSASALVTKGSHALVDGACSEQELACTSQRCKELWEVPRSEELEWYEDVQGSGA